MEEQAWVLTEDDEEVLDRIWADVARKPSQGSTEASHKAPGHAQTDQGPTGLPLNENGS